MLMLRSHKFKMVKKSERHYCEVCAAQFHPFQFDVKEEPISLQQLVSNWFNITGEYEHARKEIQLPKKRRVLVHLVDLRTVSF